MVQNSRRSHRMAGEDKAVRNADIGTARPDITIATHY